MAEFLVRGITNGTTGGKWRRGDLVTVQADGWDWGVEETKAAWVAAGRPAADWPGGFYLVKVPGMSVTKARTMLADWADSLSLGDRALWRVVIADIPVAIRNILQTTGQITIGVDCTRAQAQAVLRRKDTETTADLT